MSAGDSATRLQDDGVALLRGAFHRESLSRLREAAERCFDSVEVDIAAAERYEFNRFSHSMPVTALNEFGCGESVWMAPLAAPGLNALLTKAVGGAWFCDLKHAWVRKKFAPGLAPAGVYRLQDWHQDGALGVQFAAEASPVPPMTELLTCWIPLGNCGVNSPGLEFVRGPQDGLLHFTELEDAALRRRFAAEEFLRPEFAFGDGAIFLNSVLHRSYVAPAMRRNRLSVEYRIFPCHARV